jgi:5-aminolevulinate synthase
MARGGPATSDCTDTMFDYHGFFDDRLAALHREQRYRRFRRLTRTAGQFPRAHWHPPVGEPRDVVVWCSNDYLGMSQHPVVLDAARAALECYGTGAGGTRNISGTHSLLVELEAELAAVQGREAALLFSSGYVANDTTLATLGRHLPGCVFLSDAKNHASMIEGMRRSSARVEVFAHNDAADLAVRLQRTDPGLPRVVAFESLYSMDGDLAPLAALVGVARRHRALVYVDETHAVGAHGPGGAGLVAAAGLSAHVDIVQGGLGKAYGVVGGFITGGTALIDFIRSHAPGFIFTTALPPADAAAALASVRQLRHDDGARLRLFERVSSVRQGLAALGTEPRDSQSQILPLIIGDAERCEQLAQRLLVEFGLYLQPINYPTVPRGADRLRITPTALHDAAMIDALLAGLKACLPGLRRAAAA